LIVAERQSTFSFDCGVGWWPAWTAFAVEGGTATIAFDVHLEDSRVMDETVDGGERHSLIRKNFAHSPNG
jgi:hypothetical protein